MSAHIANNPHLKTLIDDGLQIVRLTFPASSETVNSGALLKRRTPVASTPA